MVIARKVMLIETVEVIMCTLMSVLMMVYTWWMYAYSHVKIWPGGDGLRQGSSKGSTLAVGKLRYQKLDQS